MDETTMALLTGLLGTAIGAVLIGGALLAAYLVGRERGRRAARDEAPESLSAADVRLRLLEEGYQGLRHDVDQMNARLPAGERIDRR